MQSKGAAIRKRTQIAIANRVMFLWVAGVSIIFGFALVGAIFLTQMLLFNERVLQEKDKTIATLDENYENVKKLESQIRGLDANQALIDSKSPSDKYALQVILDALPSCANSDALGASLERVLLYNITGLKKIESMNVEYVPCVDSLNVNSLVQDASTTSSTSESSDSSLNQIAFNFKVSGDYTAMKQVLLNLEKSIRTINVTSLKIENQTNSQTLSVQGVAYYEPARVVKLEDKTVK